MSLITIVVVLIIVGVGMYLINQNVPMDGKIKKILNYVVVIVVILWLLNVFNFWGHVGSVKI